MESTVVEKDIPYTACVVFLVLLLAELVRTIKDSEPLSKKQIAGLILVCLGTAGFRNEGIYLVLVSAVAAIAYGWMEHPVIRMNQPWYWMKHPVTRGKHPRMWTDRGQE